MNFNFITSKLFKSYRLTQSLLETFQLLMLTRKTKQDKCGVQSKSRIHSIQATADGNNGGKCTYVLARNKQGARKLEKCIHKCGEMGMHHAGNHNHKCQ